MWDQNMGHGRGITCEIQTDCLDTAVVVWEKCCLGKLNDEVRNAKVYFQDKSYRPLTRSDWPRQHFDWNESKA